MDGEAREYSQIDDIEPVNTKPVDAKPVVLEDALEKDIRDLTAFWIGQERLLAVHAYTDRFHFRQTFRGLLKDAVPPQYEKAFEHLLERLEEIATRAFPEQHPTAIIRVILNVARHPIVDRPVPGSPTAFGIGDIEKSVLIHGLATADNVEGLDPKLHNIPAGFAFLAEAAFEDPADRSTQENKPPNMYMFNESELRAMAELRAEQMRRLSSPETEKVSKGEKAEEAEAEEEAEGPEAKTWQEQQNEENKEFFERRETAERINRARERIAEAFENARRRDEQFFDRQRDQAKEAREAQERNDEAVEDRNRANEETTDRQRESDERYRGARESDSTALENVARSNEDAFRRQEDQASRREEDEAAARRYEAIEADNALAEAIARLEATFGLIAEHEEEIGRAPYAASELMVLGGEMMALVGILARGIGREDLRARAALDIQRALELGPELRRLGAAAALEAGEEPQVEGAEEAAGAPAEAGVEAPGAEAEAGAEGARAEGSPTAAELAEAVAEITGEPVAAGEEVTAAELPEVIGFEGGGEPVAEGEIPEVIEAAAEETPEAEAVGGEAVPLEEIPEIIEPTEARGPEAQGMEVPPEEIPEVVEPVAAGEEEPGAPVAETEVSAAPESEPEEEPQPSEGEAPSLIEEEIKEEAIGKARDEMAPAETAPTIEAPPTEPTEPTEPREPAEAAAGGGEEEEEEPPVTETEERETEEVEARAADTEGERRAGGPEAAPPPGGEPEPEEERQPSEGEAPSLIKDEIVEDAMGKAREEMAPFETASTMEAPPTEPTEPTEPREPAEAAAGGGEEEEEEPPVTETEERETEEVEARAADTEGERRAGGPEAAPPPGGEPEPEEERQPSEGEAPSLIKDEIVEDAMGKAREEMAPFETASTMEAPPTEPTEPTEPREPAEAAAGGGEEEEEEPPVTAAEEDKVRSPGTSDERRAGVSETKSPSATEPGAQSTEPSEQRPPHSLGQKAKEHVVEEALSKAAQPPSAPPAAEAEKKTAGPSEPSSAEDAEEPSLLGKIVEKAKEVIRPLTSEGAAVRKNEAAIKRAGRAQERIDAAAARPSRNQVGLQRLQKETGPQARQEAEKSEKEKPEEKERTGTGKTGSGSGGRTKGADVEKAVEMAVRENRAAETARVKVAEETREMRMQQNQKQARKKPALARKPRLAKTKTPLRRASAMQKQTARKHDRPHANKMAIKRPPLPPKKPALPEKRKPLPGTAAVTEQKRRQLKNMIKPRPAAPASEPAPE